jgi:hypothetical protein
MLVAMILMIQSFFLAEANHKFYVSKTTIEWSPASDSYQISMKIFTDDLDKALSLYSGAEMNVGTEKESDECNAVLSEYLGKKFYVKMNQNNISWHFVGKETEGDLTWVYLEYTWGTSVQTIELSNTCLFELFDDQQNIVDFRANGSTQTVILTKYHPMEILYR